MKPEEARFLSRIPQHPGCDGGGERREREDLIEWTGDGEFLRQGAIGTG